MWVGGTRPGAGGAGRCGWVGLGQVEVERVGVGGACESCGHVGMWARGHVGTWAWE